MENKIKELIAIAFNLDGKAFKYHVRNKPIELERFESFLIRSGFGIMYCNYYDKKSRKFLIRHKF